MWVLLTTLIQVLTTGTYPSLSKDVWSPEIGETLDVRLVPNTPVN